MEVFNLTNLTNEQRLYPKIISLESHKVEHLIDEDMISASKYWISFDPDADEAPDNLKDDDLLTAAQKRELIDKKVWNIDTDDQWNWVETLHDGSTWAGSWGCDVCAMIREPETPMISDRYLHDDYDDEPTRELRPLTQDDIDELSAALMGKPWPPAKPRSLPLPPGFVQLSLFQDQPQ